MAVSPPHALAWRGRQPVAASGSCGQHAPPHSHPCKQPSFQFKPSSNNRGQQARTRTPFKQVRQAGSGLAGMPACTPQTEAFATCFGAPATCLALACADGASWGSRSCAGWGRGGGERHEQRGLVGESKPAATGRASCLSGPRMHPLYPASVAKPHRFPRFLLVVSGAAPLRLRPAHSATHPALALPLSPM